MKTNSDGASAKQQKMSHEWHAGYTAAIYGDTIVDFDSYPEDWKDGYKHGLSSCGCYTVSATTGADRRDR